MIGIGIDVDTGDIAMTDDNSLQMVTGAEAVLQHAIERVRTFEGEWFLDLQAGLPWFQRILGQRFDETLVEALVKGEIYETAGCTGITSFSAAFSKRERVINLRQIRISTIFDED